MFVFVFIFKFNLKGREDRSGGELVLEASKNSTVEQLKASANILTVNSLLGLNLDVTLLKNTTPLVADSATTTTTNESSGGEKQQKTSLSLQHLFQPPQIFSFDTQDGCQLHGMIYLPFNYESGVKYPTVVYVYAGPKVQLVSNSYKSNK